jgi:Mlc titration factor MtfA (ptsG expression regulator)
MLKALLARLGSGSRVAIPPDLWDATLAELPFCTLLSGAERARLRELAEHLLADKEMAAADGLELTAAMQVSIAIQACLPILNLGLHWYRGWTSIVVYPTEFLVPRSITDDDGVVHEFIEPVSGEAWDGGPLVLSWDDAQRDSTEIGLAYNVVVHEFTHKLDMLNGEADGLPPFDRALHGALDATRWQQVLDDAYGRFCAELDLIEDEMPADVDPESEAALTYYLHLPLDPYAAQDEGEFFAVSSEQFFIDPARLHAAFPAWYDLLRQFFCQDPLARMPSA